MWIKKYWPALLAAALQAENLWKMLKWALDWRGRYDSLAKTYHDVGGASAVIGYILDPPPWFYPLSFLAGILLIWWNFHRNHERANATISPPHEEVFSPAVKPAERSKPPIAQYTPAPVVEAPVLQPSPAPIVEVTIAPSPATLPPPIPPEKPSKEFVDANVTPEFLLGLYEGQTSLGAERLASQYIGKWMPVSGTLLDRTFGGDKFLGSRLPAVASFSQGPSVIMMFRDEWIDRLAKISTSQIITVHGQIKEIERSKISLDNCELTDSEPTNNSTKKPLKSPARRRKQSSKVNRSTSQG